MTDPAGVIFDLDGTLVDSSHDIAHALNRMLATRGLGTVTAGQVEPLLGEGALSLVGGIHALLDTGADPAQIREDTASYLARYAEEPVRDSLLFRDARPALVALTARGTVLGVCTNKDHDLAVQVLRGLGIADHFGCVVGGDDLPVRKPDPEHLLAAVRALGLTPESVLYVGDSVIDAECAERAGIRCLLVDWALTDRPETRLHRFMDLVPTSVDPLLTTSTAKDL